MARNLWESGNAIASLSAPELTVTSRGPPGARLLSPMRCLDIPSVVRVVVVVILLQIVSSMAFLSAPQINLATSPAAAQLISRAQSVNSTATTGIAQQAVLLGNANSPTLTASQAQMYLRAQMVSSNLRGGGGWGGLGGTWG
uniref:Uncharacterized protein n=1 Tax=Callorhinchus milii TaxID=7868 RepID=A0A4W3GJY8_CALMI